MGKLKALLSELSDDDFINCICQLLEYRGKADVASRLRSTYYGLGADKAHFKESGQVLRTERILTGESFSWPSQSSFSTDGPDVLRAAGNAAAVSKNDPDDLYRSSDN